MQVHSWSGDSRSLELAAAIEKQSEHPIAIAIGEYWSNRACGEKSPDAELVEMHLGGGVSGWVSGSEVHVGSANFMEQQGIAIGSEFLEKQQQLLSAGHTPIFVSVQRKLVAIAGVGDSIRPKRKHFLSDWRSEAGNARCSAEIIRESSPWLVSLWVGPGTSLRRCFP